mmetsp:Transcript_8868/g.37532  ORF Transcript_8868/g.37532 Transcript_8868/m.37532 type:complete len:331 (+) Transcript_8868:67-1059(+)
MPRAARSAKRRKTRVEGGDAAARGGHDEGESGDGANLLCALPLALQEHIASLLDHDSLFTSARVCKAWRDVVSSASPTPMRGVLKRIVEGNAQLLKLIDHYKFNDRDPPPSWLADQPDRLEILQHRRDTGVRFLEMYTEEARRHRDDPEWMGIQTSVPFGLLELARDRARGAESRFPKTLADKWTSRDVYKHLYGRSCYDCASFCHHLWTGPRKVVNDDGYFDPFGEIPSFMRETGGALKMRLCKACSGGYAKSTPAQRLATGAAAKDFFLLRPADLSPLPHGIDTNPVDPGWAPMRLYRKVDVTEAALARWGDRASWEKERHKRLVGKA